MVEVQEELKYLRKKVNKLESTIQFIQNELQNKLGSVLERFFDQRASQLAKQKRAIQVEEDFCLDLLSCCADLQEADSNFNKGLSNSTSAVSSVPCSNKRVKTESATVTAQKRKRGRPKKPKNQSSQETEVKETDTDSNVSSNDYSDDGSDDDDGSDHHIRPSVVAIAGVNEINQEDVEQHPEPVTIKTETQAATDLMDYSDEGMEDNNGVETTERQDEEEDLNDEEDVDYLAGRKRSANLKWKLVQLFDNRSAADTFTQNNWARQTFAKHVKNPTIYYYCKHHGKHCPAKAKLIIPSSRSRKLEYCESEGIGHVDCKSNKCGISKEVKASVRSLLKIGVERPTDIIRHMVAKGETPPNKKQLISFLMYERRRDNQREHSNQEEEGQVDIPTPTLASK